MFDNKESKKDTQIELEYGENYASIFDKLHLQLQELGFTGFAYIQLPHIGAIDFKNPIKMTKGLPRGADLDITNLDSKTIISVCDNPKGNGYYQAHPVKIKVENNNCLTLSLSQSNIVEHFCCLTWAPPYALGCFLLLSEGVKNSESLYEAHSLCNTTQLDLNKAQATINRLKDIRSKLTDREKSVMELVIQGQSNSSIANVLNISPPIVSMYIQHVIVKLRVQNRISAVLRIIAEDLIEY